LADLVSSKIYTRDRPLEKKKKIMRKQKPKKKYLLNHMGKRYRANTLAGVLWQWLTGKTY